MSKHINWVNSQFAHFSCQMMITGVLKTVMVCISENDRCSLITSSGCGSRSVTISPAFIPSLFCTAQDPAAGIQSTALSCLGKLSAADPLLSQVRKRERRELAPALIRVEGTGACMFICPSHKSLPHIGGSMHVSVSSLWGNGGSMHV